MSGISESLDDGSGSQDSFPATPGRFENGVVHLGGIEGPNTGKVIDTNGEFKLNMANGQTQDSILGRVHPPPPANSIPVRINEIEDQGIVWELHLGAIPPGFPWGQLTPNGKISYGTGAAMDIIQENEALSTVSVLELEVLVHIYDDDDLTAFSAENPTIPAEDPDTALDWLNGALGPAYMYSQLDGAGDVANNAAEIPFYSNISPLSLNGIVTGGSSPRDHPATSDTPHYWAIYFGCAFQEESTLYDHDSSLEGARFGGTYGTTYEAEVPGNPSMPGVLGLGAIASYAYHETIDDYIFRDPTLFALRIQKNIAHEIAHQLGVPHHDRYGSKVGQRLMDDADQPENSTPGYYNEFTEFHIHLLRCVEQTLWD